MPDKRNRLRLSSVLLKNAEFGVKQIREGCRDKEGMTRMACHAYYYSIHHKCRAFMLSLKGGHNVHRQTQEELTKKDKSAGEIYGDLKRARVWADYNPGKADGSSPPIGLELIIDKYNELDKIVDSAKWD
jgi:hypothetical protein